MAQNPNIDVVKRCYDAFQRGDINALLGDVADDAEWEAVVGIGNRIPIGGLRRGKRDVQEFFRTLSENTRFESFEPRQYLGDGDHVIVLGHYLGTVPRTGRRFDSDWVMVFRLKDRKIVQFREFTNTAATLEAFGVGLGQPAMTETRRPGAEPSH